jgi:hypothetical protein
MHHSTAIETRVQPRLSRATALSISPVPERQPPLK